MPAETRNSGDEGESGDEANGDEDTPAIRRARLESSLQHLQEELRRLDEQHPPVRETRRQRQRRTRGDGDSQSAAADSVNDSSSCVGSRSSAKGSGNG